MEKKGGNVVFKIKLIFPIKRFSQCKNYVTNVMQIIKQNHMVGIVLCLDDRTSVTSFRANVNKHTSLSENMLI